MILVCGEALVDVFPDGSVSPGGSPFNVAIGLARLGSPVALAAPISDDPRGALLRAALVREGVDTGALRALPSATPAACVTLSADGSPEYSFQGLDELDLGLSPSDSAGATCLHAGSYALVSRASEALLNSFRNAPRSVLLSLDPNVRTAMEPSLQRWRDAVTAFAAQANLIKASEEDIGTLAGPNADSDAVAAAWLSDRCPLVALTRGEKGATLFSRRHGRIDAAAHRVEPVDTVGAGDSFQAAFLAGLDRAGARSAEALDALSRDALGRLLETAVKASALTCARRGADPPTEAELGGL